MSITLLMEQNVYRYYALTEHTLSHYCLQGIKSVSIRVSPPVLSLFVSVCLFVVL